MIIHYLTQSVVAMRAGPEEPRADRRWRYWLGDGICLGSTGLEGYGCRVPGPSMPFDGSGDHESVHSRPEEAGAQVQVQNEGICSASEKRGSSSFSRMSERKLSRFDLTSSPVNMFPDVSRSVSVARLGWSGVESNVRMGVIHSTTTAPAKVCRPACSNLVRHVLPTT